LTRYIKSIGPKAKLSKSEVSSFALCSVAAYYCGNARFEEAQIYAQAAMATSSSNSPLQGISEAIQFEALSSLRVNGLSGPDSEILSKYQSALAAVQWSWGEDHPLSMAVYDRLSLVYLKGKDPENALQAHFNSLCIAENSLGKNHPITAGYLAKVVIPSM
jgi:hypothetical protein